MEIKKTVCVHMVLLLLELQVILYRRGSVDLFYPVHPHAKICTEFLVKLLYYKL